jgi:hemolysin activation/secretion protein
MIALLYGYEVGSNSSRPYYGIKTGYSLHHDSVGYIFGGFQIGAYRSKGQWLNRNSMLELLYFSNLNTIGSWKVRQYIGTRYSYRFDPLRPGDVLDINNAMGLRGFSDGYLKGAKKVVVNYEANFFTPLKLVGFKLAIITFADFGLIASNNRSIYTSKFFQGYGLGFRIKNEHLIFPAFQFMFGYYPNIHISDGDHYRLFRQTATYYRFNKFQFSNPTIVSAE